jgi:predicted MFS family arabinose efflux permease
MIYASMFLIAAFLWFLAAFLFYLIKEEKGATQGGRNPLMESKAGIDLIKKDSNFRNFLITRALLMAIPLLQPFYVLIAKGTSSASWNFLGYLIIVSGLAQVISSPFWGKIADQSATRLMRISGIIAIGAAIYALTFHSFANLDLGFYAFLPVIFINGIAYSGARLSRKTYLVNFAPKDDRSTYVSVANTVIGLFTLVAATFGIIAAYFGLSAQLIFFIVLLLLAVLLSYKLKKV